MAVKWYWRFASTTLDGTHDHYEGSADSTATINGSATLSSTAARVGTNGGLFAPSSTDQFRFDTSTDLIDRIVGSLAFSMRMATAPAATRGIVEIRGASGNFQVWIVGDEVRVYNNVELAGEDELTTDGADLAEDVWYGVVFRWDQPNSLRRIEIYDASGEQVTFVEETTAWTAPTDLATSAGLRIGNTTGSDGDIHIDNFFIADAYDEPLEDNFTITSFTEYDDGEGITSATLDFTGANGFFDENGDAVDAEDLTLYVWRSPRPPSSGGAPDQIITDIDIVDGELSQAIDLGELEEDDTVFGMLFGAAGTNLYWAGEVTPVYG